MWKVLNGCWLNMIEENSRCAQCAVCSEQCALHTVHCVCVCTMCSAQCAQCSVCWKCWGVLHINSLLLGHSAHSMTITMMAIMLTWWTLWNQIVCKNLCKLLLIVKQTYMWKPLLPMMYLSFKPNWCSCVTNPNQIQIRIRMRQRCLRALGYERFLFPPAA